jgi:hypothetical protein
VYLKQQSTGRSISAALAEARGASMIKTILTCTKDEHEERYEQNTLNIFEVQDDED